MVEHIGVKAKVAAGTNTGVEPLTQPYPHE
jgi:hypothetical protein